MRLNVPSQLIALPILIENGGPAVVDRQVLQICRVADGFTHALAGAFLAPIAPGHADDVEIAIAVRVSGARGVPAKILYDGVLDEAALAGVLEDVRRPHVLRPEN